MRKAFFVVLALFFSQNLFAQSVYTVSGRVRDTLNFGFTQYTAVSLIDASDSVLVSFTRADENGAFSLEARHPGAYLLLFEHPLFATFVDNIRIEKNNTDLGIVPMISKRNLLKDVVIVGKNAITIKGDTIEYLADSFQTGQYDNVDALLRQLPGIEVNSDGSIKAYGKTVKKMLVDGEEFFSDDPAMVSKMLRASTVKTVQVYDDKTKKTKFTGIDDGTRIKTINLELKEDAKNGYFGKVSFGGGLPDYWQNSAMINAFKKKRKLSAYALMSNTQQTGLNRRDSRQYGGGGGGGIVTSNGSFVSFGNGNFGGQGLPKAWKGGLHYNNSWWGDTLSFNGSYNFSKNNNNTLNNTVTKYILPDTQYFNYNDAQRFRSNMKHNLSLSSTYKIDSLSSLYFHAKAGLGKTRTENSHHSTAQTTIFGDLINENNQMQTSDRDNQDANIYLRYKKKFKKKGRSFSANVSANWSKSSSKGILTSEYHLFAIDSTRTIDQRKLNDNQSQSTGIGLNYTEPLFEEAFLLFNYHFNINNQMAHVQSFNKLPGLIGGYEDVLDSLYSSQYSYRVMENKAGLRFQYNPTEKIHITVGGDIAGTRYTQEDLMYDSTVRYNYLNFFPSVRFQFKKSRMSSVSFYYNGRNLQPSLRQLQPVRNNEDPLNVAIGNPDLKQAFVHDFRLFYYSYQVLTSQNLFVMGHFSTTQNAITMKQNLDLSGRRTYQYVNVDGNYNAGLTGNYGRKIVGKFRANVGISASYNRTHNFINNQANTNNTWVFGPSINLRYNLDTTLRLHYSFKPTYNSTISDIRTDIETNYWNFQQSLTARYQLPFRFEIGTGVDWYIRQQLSTSDRHNKVFLWNAWLSRSFLKDKSLVLKIYANDILNQNIGYNRVTTANQISESNYNTIQRYLMLSITWNFTHSGGKGQESDVAPVILTN